MAYSTLGCTIYRFDIAGSNRLVQGNKYGLLPICGKLGTGSRKIARKAKSKTLLEVNQSCNNPSSHLTYGVRPHPYALCPQ